jgi:hypothetical protein
MTSTTYAPAQSTATRSTKATPGMTPMRKTALAAGVLYLITFAASIPQLKLFKKLIDDPSGFVSGHASNTAVLWGSLLEIVTAAAGIGTAVVLYAVNRRVSRTAAIGFVTTRVVEGILIIVGVMSILSVVTLKSDFASAAGSQADSLRVTASALVDARQWTFLLGPGIIPAFNALFLGYVLYRSGLVPRILPIIGLVGAPLLLISATSTIFGGWSQTSGTAFFFALPIAVWEFSLGVYLTFKGFKQTSLTETSTS